MKLLSKAAVMAIIIATALPASAHSGNHDYAALQKKHSDAFGESVKKLRIDFRNPPTVESVTNALKVGYGYIIVKPVIRQPEIKKCFTATVKTSSNPAPLQVSINCYASNARSWGQK